MNRAGFRPGWPRTGRRGSAQALGGLCSHLYDIVDRLRASIQTRDRILLGGGGRVDLGILHRVDEVWPSDNTEAFDRLLRIQEGFSAAYAAKIMSAG